MTIVGLIFTFSASAQIAKPIVQADISSVADTAHLEFKGMKNWHYDVQRSGEKKIVLNIPAMDKASVAKLQSFSDPMIDSIKVQSGAPDGQFAVTFTLSQPNVESFDYLTDEPSRLIIDFYRKNEADAKKATAAPKAAAKGKKKTTPKKRETAQSEEKDHSRQPAGDEFLSVDKDEKSAAPGLHAGIFDGGDDNYDRFRIKSYEIRDEAIIASRHNIYLPFPMLKMKVSQLDKLMELQPEYVINPKDTKENKEARLLLTLFLRKRDGVFLKTYDYFVNKYPESEYSEIIKNLAANVYLKRWRNDGKSVDFEQARALYNELVQKFKDSPLREYNYEILGFMQMERGDALSTLQTFEGFLKTYPKSPEVPHIRNAVAESYMILRKYEEATAEYNTLIKDFPKSEFAQEARYRLGDVAFAKGDYTNAIRLYEAAIKELPAQEKVYPNANFNMAEARFWQKDYVKSLNNYVQFVNLFPTNDFGGYALTRIGELLGILGADQRRVMGAFLESYFRFPNHPGAKVARIRMLSQQMRSMKPNELKRAKEEIEGIADKLSLDGIKEFTTLMLAEGLSNRGQYQEAMDNLIAYYQKNPTSANLDFFKSRILRNISNELKDKVDKGQFMDALAFYSKYSQNWLKNTDRIDIPYLVGGAYENAGAYSEANAIYKKALDHRKTIVGTTEEKERKVQEHLPSVASLHLRMAETAAQDRNYLEAYQNLKEIGADAELTPAETVERIQLSALIAEQRNDNPRAREALLELTKKWQGDPALVAPVHLQLAQTYMKMGDPKAAEAQADKALSAEGSETKIADKVIAQAMQVKGDALLAQKKTLAAVESYQNLLDRYESSMPLGSVRYHVGQILFDRGDLKGAAEIWGKLEGTPNEFLWKIGKEKLEDAKWQGDYTKYMNRIPAMASSKKEKNP
jgi:tetratricopeptide (TPR) repeat protein